MSKPLLNIRLSDDGNSLFLYTGEGEHEQLEACLGLQREDLELQLIEYVNAAVLEHFQYASEMPRRLSAERDPADEEDERILRKFGG